MNFSSPILRIPFRYGLIGGTLGGSIIILLYALGIHPLLLPLIVDFRIAIFSIFIYLSLKELRDGYYQGELYFWQGMVASYLFVFTAAIIVASITWFLARGSAAFISTYIDKPLQQLLDNKKEFIESVGAQAYKQQLLRLPSTTAMDLASDYFLKSMIIGLFLAIVFSVILRRTPNLTKYG